MIRLMSLAVVVMSAAIAAPSFAQELNYNVVEMSASAQSQVPNDLMRVTIVSRHQDSRADQAANKVNKDMAWALSMLKSADFIEHQTGSYNTHPVYKDSRIIAWGASQTLVLRSSDFSKTAKIVAKLQERLAVQEMQFLAKDETREKVQNALISDAISAFKAKAKIVQESMGARGFDVVQVYIDQQGNRGSQPYFRQEMAMHMAKDSVATPALAAGESKLQVTVRGSIQLKH